MDFPRAKRYSLTAILNQPQFNFVLFGAAAYSFILSNTCTLKEATCIDYYWLDHWLIGYSGGFVRRGFLGWLHYTLFGSTLNIPVLNLFCLVVVVVIFAITAQSLLAVQNTHSQRIIIVLMIGSPVFSVFIETLGDPLHVCILLYLLVGWLIISGAPRSLVVIIVFASIIVSSLIHEASLLLLAPAFIALSARPDKDGFYKRYVFLIFIVLVSVGIGYGALLVHFTETISASASTGDVRGFNPFNAVKLYRYSGYQSVTFLELLKETYQIYFGGPSRLVDFFLKILRSGVVPISFFLLQYFSFCCATKRTVFVRLYTSLAVTSFPLYVIAYDWGRFAVYTLLTAIISALIIFHFLASSEYADTRNSIAVAPSLRAISPEAVALSFFFISAILYPINPQYRIDGIPKQNALAVIIGLTASSGLFLIFKNFTTFSGKLSRRRVKPKK